MSGHVCIHDEVAKDVERTISPQIHEHTFRSLAATTPIRLTPYFLQLDLDDTKSLFLNNLINQAGK